MTIAFPQPSDDYWRRSNYGNDHPELRPQLDETVYLCTLGRRYINGLFDHLLFWILLLMVPSPLSNLIFIAWLANNIVAPGLSGKSLGKWMTHTTLVWVPHDIRDNPWTQVIPGVGRCALRLPLFIFLDVAFIFGIFRPIWNHCSRTWCESITHTVVVWDYHNQILSRAEYRRRLRRYIIR